MKDRGAYMGINSSIQQVSGGIASFWQELLFFNRQRMHRFSILIRCVMSPPAQCILLLV